MKKGTHTRGQQLFTWSPEDVSKVLHEIPGRLEHSQHLLVGSRYEPEPPDHRQALHVVAVDLRPGDFVPRLLPRWYILISQRRYQPAAASSPPDKGIIAVTGYRFHRAPAARALHLPSNIPFSVSSDNREQRLKDSSDTFRSRKVHFLWGRYSRRKLVNRMWLNVLIYRFYTASVSIFSPFYSLPVCHLVSSTE